MSKTVLMLATFGLEVLEVGGTLALHAQAGDQVHVAVLQTRDKTHPQIEQATRMLGAATVYFFDMRYGEIELNLELKLRLVRLFRELKPDILITQDPEHSAHDLDPDRRLAMLWYLEAVALAGRDWRIAEGGGFAPHSIHHIYYMTPENPNCIVEISSTFAQKQQALDVLNYQLAYSAKVIKEKLDEAVLRDIAPGYDTVKQDNRELGRALHHEMDRALAMYHGVLSHSGAAMAEAFRYQGQFKLDKLI